MKLFWNSAICKALYNMKAHFLIMEIGPQNEKLRKENERERDPVTQLY